jgi:hypothetical protein
MFRKWLNGVSSLDSRNMWCFLTASMIEGRWLKGGGGCSGAVCTDVVVWDNFISRTCYALTLDATLLGIGTSIIKMQQLSNNQPGFADMGLIRHPKLESSADGDKHKVSHMQW